MHRIWHGTEPESMADLWPDNPDWGDRVKDPWGQALVFGRTGAGVLIYSKGPNQLDDQGDDVWPGAACFVR